MSGRAIWGNIQFEGGSIGPTEGRDKQNPRTEYFPLLPDPRNAIIYLLYDTEITQLWEKKF